MSALPQAWSRARGAIRYSSGLEKLCGYVYIYKNKYIYTYINIRIGMYGGLFERIWDKLPWKRVFVEDGLVSVIPNAYPSDGCNA